MATRIESRIGRIEHPADRIFDYLSDFHNFSSMVPEDRVSDFEAETDRCRFTVEGIGQVGLQIVEKRSPELIKISSDEQTAFDFHLWIQVKEAAPGDSRMKITTEVMVNAMMAPMVKGPLKTFVDTLVEQAEQLDFSSPPANG